MPAHEVQTGSMNGLPSSTWKNPPHGAWQRRTYSNTGAEMSNLASRWAL